MSKNPFLHLKSFNKKKNSFKDDGYEERPEKPIV
jgi:hypothetical protein